LVRCGKLVAPMKKRTTIVPCFLGKRGSHFGGQPFQFTFCPNSSAGCIQNVVYGLAGSKPDIPKVWPVAPGTQLNQEEADALRAAGFVVMQGVPNDERVEAHVSSDRPPLDNINWAVKADKTPTIRNNIRVNPRKEKKENFANRDRGSTMIATVLLAR
jgi:hypothetical protein